MRIVARICTVIAMYKRRHGNVFSIRQMARTRTGLAGKEKGGIVPSGMVECLSLDDLLFPEQRGRVHIACERARVRVVCPEIGCGVECVVREECFGRWCEQRAWNYDSSLRARGREAEKTVASQVRGGKRGDMMMWVDGQDTRNVTESHAVGMYVGGCNGLETGNGC